MSTIRSLLGPILALLLACSTESAAPAPAGPALDLGRPARFACGAQLACDARTSYCELVKTDVAELPSTYTCKPLPEACVPSTATKLPDCSCFPAGTRCKSFCRRVTTPSTPLQGFNLVCIGGA